MKVNFLGRFPDNYSAYGKLAEFDEYDLEYLTGHAIDEIWYWYSTAPYEGSGQILMRRGDLYDLHDAGHCSCYGPTERIKFVGKTLNELYQQIHKEYFENEIRPLFEMAGFKQ